MNKYYYDFHIHSCLSPCADNENTPNNIVGMGVLAGLNIMALTDHNSCKNCPPFFVAAKKNGIIPVAGMELTTSEDIHMICLFEHLEGAMEFDKYIEQRRVLIKNREDIFGEQLILDELDNIIGKEEYLLSNATDVSIDETVELVKRFDGICYPAHIDREANGLLAILGFFPPTPIFENVEINNTQNKDSIISKHNLFDKRIIIGSDAHYLWGIKDKEEYFIIDNETKDDDILREMLFKQLRERI